MATEPAKVQDSIRFGEGFEFDLRTYKLHRDGRILKLERIPTEILLLLIKQNGQLVTREQIVERIWGKEVFLDTDNSINGAIRKIRQVLKDDPEQPRFIQTISGRGYRFIAQVAGAAEEQEAGLETQQRLPQLEGALSSPSTRYHLGKSALAIALTLLILAAIGLYLRSRPQTRPQSQGGRVMLAVLPFENLTGDAGEEYFSDGLTEEMITQLGNLDPEHLGVIARTSVMHYKGGRTPLNEVGHELGVQYVIEGSVRRDANNVRVSAQLIQTKDQTHVWARQYDRELRGLLTLQGEIAQEIADEMQLTLGGHKPSPAAALSPSQYEAYDLYLKGQYFFEKRTVLGFEEAINYFQQALAKNPNDARAYAGIANSYSLMAGYSSRPQSEFMSKAREAALKSLQLDDRLPEAHTALALVVQNNDWDWQTAEKEFHRAMELNPNYATAHHWYAEHLMWRGRFNQALQESERARRLDPLSLIIAADNGAILYFSRQYDRALDKWRSVLEMDPDFPRAHLIMHALVEKGMFTEARAVLEKERGKMAEPWYWNNLAYICARAGQLAEARHALHELLQANERSPVDARIIAQVYSVLGENDQALAWLEKAYTQHSNELIALKIDPSYDSLRGDPRFEGLLQRVGLAN